MAIGQIGFLDDDRFEFGDAFDDNGPITIAEDFYYRMERVVYDATHTLTASLSGHLTGHTIKVRYLFLVDCTITLINFDPEGNATGLLTPIPAGIYDFCFDATPFGASLRIPKNVIGIQGPAGESANVLSGTGEPPSPIGLPNNTLYIKYE